MKKRWVVLLGLMIITSTAMSDQAYLTKLTTYLAWAQNLPQQTDPDFLAFIETPSPLTVKLREKWLYQLANKNQWRLYEEAYRGSSDVNLICYEGMAHYQLGHHEQALRDAMPWWLRGSTQPKICETLFTLLIHDHRLTNQDIRARITLALAARNLNLVRSLLTQLTPTQPQDAKLISAIQQNPARILQLSSNSLHNEFYLYGLKLWVARDLPKAIEIGSSLKTRQRLTPEQQQAFIAHVALYKAMRQQPDAAAWFARVKPDYVNDVLLDWAIRSALSEHRWHDVLQLIPRSKEHEEPCWQYWMARAWEALGDTEKATLRFQELAKKRHYYGFLSSLRLHQPFAFENEPVSHNPQTLVLYQPIIEQIKQLHITHQDLAAARLLTDFISELPKAEQSTVIDWVANHLHWYDRSVYLSNNEALTHQLSLRFPLPYRQIIDQNAKQRHVPPELVFAMIRQESTFHENIRSPVGAQGLMQIMPHTAKMVAKRAHIAYTNEAQLFSSEKNIALGTAYLQQLSEQYHGHPILMAAAYNAGPKQVKHWLSHQALDNIDLWIETLPWAETRNYLKNIVAFYAVYQYRLHAKIDLNPFMQPF